MGPGWIWGSLGRKAQASLWGRRGGLEASRSAPLPWPVADTFAGDPVAAEPVAGAAGAEVAARRVVAGVLARTALSRSPAFVDIWGTRGLVGARAGGVTPRGMAPGGLSAPSRPLEHGPCKDEDKAAARRPQAQWPPPSPGLRGTERGPACGAHPRRSAGSRGGGSRAGRSSGSCRRCFCSGAGTAWPGTHPYLEGRGRGSVAPSGPLLAPCPAPPRTLAAVAVGGELHAGAALADEAALGVDAETLAGSAQALVDVWGARGESGKMGGSAAGTPQPTGTSPSRLTGAADAVGRLHHGEAEGADAGHLLAPAVVTGEVAAVLPARPRRL